MMVELSLKLDWMLRLQHTTRPITYHSIEWIKALKFLLVGLSIIGLIILSVFGRKSAKSGDEILYDTHQEALIQTIAFSFLLVSILMAAANIQLFRKLK